MSKPKYKIGDYVRIKNISIYDEYPSGIVDDMLEFANKLARITNIRYESNGENYCYYIDLDNGKWDWDEDMFEYRLGNYEDNVIVPLIYIIGYKFKGKTYEFKGQIKNFIPNGLCEFNKDEQYLAIPYKWIEYIVPIENEGDSLWESLWH